MEKDKILYRDFLKGSIESFESLVIAHKDNLIYFISRYTGGDIYIAEDIAQDVFAFIYVNKEKYDLKYSFKTYIYTLGKNKAIDHVRKQSRMKLIPFDKDYEILQSEEESLEDMIIKNEEEKMLINNMKKLKADYQKAIYLADFEELPYKEIGEILGKTLGQTKVLIHRARKALRLILETGVDKYER